MKSECLEILSIDLLNTVEYIIQEFNDITSRLDIGLIWHYLLDLSWAAQQLNPSNGMRIVDAGAGMGIM